jgi:hypothetical protein
VKGIQGPGSLQREIITKIRWRHSKLLLSRTTGPEKFKFTIKPPDSENSIFFFISYHDHHRLDEVTIGKTIFICVYMILELIFKTLYLQSQLADFNQS